MVIKRQGLEQRSPNGQGIDPSIWTNVCPRWAMATIALPFLIISGLSGAPVHAQAVRPTLVSLNFPPAPNRGAPTNTAGGGRRGSTCQVGRVPLTALMPYDNAGTTTLPQPTLFWYVPESLAKTAEFVLFDSNRQRLYVKTLPISAKGGIVRLTLPNTVSLQVNQNYFWRMSLICDEADRSGDVFIRGAIQRTEMSQELRAKLSRTQEPLKQAELYASAGVWSETLAIAAQLRPSNPKAWEELLTSVNLATIATAPFVN